MKYKGYVITRGSYKGTADDNMDGWYIDHPEGRTIDHRGPGHRTIADAKARINEWEHQQENKEG